MQLVELVELWINVIAKLIINSIQQATLVTPVLLYAQHLLN